MLRLFRLVAAASMATALVPSPCFLHRSRDVASLAGYGPATTTTQLYEAPKHSPLEDEPWQKDDSYWDALQAASKDPETFEKFIEESMARKKLGKSPVSSSSTAPTKNGMNGNNAAESDAPKKRGKYVPIEEWDANRKEEDMSREERLQWEAQRNGNQYRQNEILSRNLKGF